MARGQQKIQSQQKAQEKAKKSKQNSTIKQVNKALVFSCTVCKSQMPDPKTYRQHFESKHPKSPLPPELAESS